MNTSSKRLVLALAIALGSAGLHAAETPTAADQARLREDLRAAQQQLAEVSKRVAELSMEIGGDPARVQMFRYLGNPDRAVIGVILGESNRDGVGIEGVTPGGPAEKAGLRAGDTISAVGGKPVAGDSPLSALREALKNLKAGDEVSITYLRDGKSQQAKIAAERQGGLGMLGGPFFAAGNGASIHFPAEMDHEIEAIVERALGDSDGLRVNMMPMLPMLGTGGLRLTTLNPGLGHYFGVNEGVLVLEVDADEYQGLQAGDVILEVDGKAIKDPRDAMRELSDRDPAQPVEVKLQRDRVPQLVKIKVPERSGRLLELRAPTPRALPHPSAAPLPPQPPQGPHTAI